MSAFTSLWEGLQAGLEAILRMYESVLEPVIGDYAWAVSIVLLTLTVRLFLVPLAVRQTKSMRSMQRLQPELKKIQKKYEVDRSLMKTDPERYKQLKEKQREAQMALYQEHGVNPVGGCLPLLLQMPIFFALFTILRPGGDGSLRIEQLADAGFFGIDSLTNTAAGGAGVGAIILVALQVGTTYYSTKQMQGRSTQAAPEQQQVQKLMLYIMPVFLGWLSWTFPIGVVLYWVTTNVWTIGQQAVIFRQVEAQEARAEEERAQARDAARAKRRGASAGGSGDDDGSSAPPKDKTTSPKGKTTPAKGKTTPAKGSTPAKGKKKPSSGQKSGEGPAGRPETKEATSPEGNGTPGTEASPPAGNGAAPRRGGRRGKGTNGASPKAPATDAGGSDAT